jgi:aspartate/methionine/tyrosine aminotransferase
VYEKGVFEESLIAHLSDLHENVLAIKIDGVSKELYAWGLRIAFITFAGKALTKETCTILEDKCAGIIRANVSNASNISQHMALAGISNKNFINQRDEKTKILKARYDLLKRSLNQNPKYGKFFEPLPFNSGYFMCIELKKHNAEIMRKKLLKEYDLGLISVGDSTLRIAYSSCPAKSIPLIFESIYSACSSSQ